MYRRRSFYSLLAAAPVFGLWISPLTSAQIVAPTGFALVDLRGKGVVDLITVGSDHASAQINFGNNDGTFQTPAASLPLLAAGSQCRSVAGIDADGDGKMDLVVECTLTYRHNVIAVFLGNGDGTFQRPHTYSEPVNSGSESIHVGDVNGDGKPDLVVTYGGAPGDPTLAIFLNDGTGGFQLVQTRPAAANVPDAALGDFNGDGKLDVVALQYSGVKIFLGKGDGTVLFPSQNYAVSNGMQSVVAADFNGDGKLDLLTCGASVGSNNPKYNFYSILYGNGDGTFQAPKTFNNGYSDGEASGVAAADFNGDGKVDFVVAEWHPTEISVFLGNGNGTFRRPTDYPALNAFPDVPLVADLNGDGKLDIYLPENQISLINNGNGTFHEVNAFP